MLLFNLYKDIKLQIIPNSRPYRHLADFYVSQSETDGEKFLKKHAFECFDRTFHKLCGTKDEI